MHPKSTTRLAQPHFFACLLISLFFLQTATAQVKVGDNPNTIKNASLLELESTNKGFVFPRVSLAGAVTNPSPLNADILNGTMVFNTNAAFPGGIGLYVWNTGSWNALTTGASVVTSNFWNIAGNAATNSGSNFLGTTDNHSLSVRTNNLQRMIVDSLGSVGIGSANFNASSKELLLVDYGNTTSNTLATLKGSINGFLQVNLTNGSDGDAASTDYVASADNGTDGVNYIDMGINGSNYSSTADTWGGPNDAYLYANSKNLIIGTDASASSVIFLASGNSIKNNTALRIDGTSRNIIVGTGEATNLPIGNTIRAVNGSSAANLGAALTVQGGLATKSGVAGGNLNLVGGQSSSGTGGTTNVSGGASGSSTGGTLNLNGGTSTSGTAGVVVVNTAATERMRVTAAGNIGIGTGAPSNKLSVVAAADPLYLGGVLATSTLSADSLLTINAGVVKKTPFTSFASPANAWLLNGNAGTTPAINFLGTTDNIGLSLRTFNVERLRIDPTGNVGIGTSAPAYKLQVLSTADPLYLGGVAATSTLTADSVLTINAGVVKKTPFASFASPSNAWLITGNNGNKRNLNFLGNIDTAALIFKVNNAMAGLIEGTTGSNNTGIGYQTMLNNTGNANAAFGYQAMNTITGNYNAAVGYQSMYTNSGYNNTAIGYQSLAANVTSNNTALGFKALNSNTTGSAADNTAVGYTAMQTNSGASNTAVGSGALASNNSSSNTAMGVRSMNVNTSSDNNTAYGYESLKTNSNSGASNNTALGFQAMNTNTGGYNNTAVGKQAMNANSGNNNTATGLLAMNTNTGSTNTATGAQSLYNNAGGDNTANGYQAMGSATQNTGLNNTAMGVQSLFTNNAGNNNTALGKQSMFTNTGSSNTATGLQALYSNTGADNVVNGYQAMGNSGTQNTGSGNVAVGVQSLYSNGAGTSNVALGKQSMYSNSGGSNTAAGFQSLYNNSGGDNTALGYQAMGATGTTNTGSYNTAVGVQSMLNNTNGGSFNTATGKQSLNSNSGSNNTSAGFASMYTNTGSYNSGFGYQTLYNNTGDYNTAIGYQALLGNTGGSNNIAAGFQSIAVNTNSGSYNIGIGRYAFNNNAGGNYNIASGVEAIKTNTNSGSYNIASGNMAMFINTGGSHNIAMGYQSMYTNIGSIGNLAMGYQTLYNTINSASYNTALGYKALTNLAQGSNNTAVGYLADVLPTTTNLSNATAIGYNAKVGVSNAVVIGSVTDNAIVGIGTSTPANAKLHLVGTGIYGATLPPLRLTNLPRTYTAATDSILTVNGAGIVNAIPFSALASAGGSTDWSILGNTGTNSGTNFLGTIDNRSLSFRTNNFQRMVVDSLGSVGIGSTAFDAVNREKLLVDLDTITTTHTWATFRGNLNDYLQVNLKNTNSGNSASTDYVATADNGDESSNFVDMGINSSGYSATIDTWGGPNDAYLYANAKRLVMGTESSGSDVVFLVGGSSVKNNAALRIDGTTSNIVLGKGESSNAPAGNILRAPTGSTSATQSADLSVISGRSVKAGLGAGKLYLTGGTATSGAGGDVLINGGTATSGLGGNVSVGAGTSNTGTGGYVILNTAGAERMRIDPTGNVGIGTGAPGYKLSVLAASNPLYLAGVQATTTFSADSILTINAGVVKKTPYSSLPASAASNDWSQIGNAGTTPGTNFLGTTDAKALMFKVSNSQSGYLDYDGAIANTSLGYQAASGLVGTYNTSIGYQAYTSVTNNGGTSNTAVGYQSLNSNGGAAAVGNTSLGYQALKTLLNGGSYNTAIGYQALLSNANGTYNIALGYQTMSSTVNLSSNNIAIGNAALQSNNGASNNIAMGVEAMKTVTNSSSHNIALGYQSMNNSVGSTGNVAIGYQTLYSTSNSSANNTAVGYKALNTLTQGSNNTAIGNLADVSTATGISNATAIGYNAKVGASNSIVLGDASNTGLNVGIGTGAPAYKLHIIAPSNPLYLGGVQATTTLSSDSVLVINAGIVKKVASASLTGSSTTAWSTTGNSGTTAGTNFVGTTDGQALVFKSGGTQSGFLGTSSTNATALGVNSSISGGIINATAIGAGATATQSYATSLGSGAAAGGSTYATALGVNANANQQYSLAVGVSATAGGGAGSIAIGYNAASNQTNAIAIGVSSLAGGGTGAIALGNSASTTQVNSVAIGTSAIATGGPGSIAMGTSAQAGANSASLGASANASASSSTALGATSAAADNGVAIGVGAKTTMAQSVAIGNASTASAYQSIAIGYNATASTNNNTIAIGYGVTTTGYQSTTVGYGSTATGSSTVALGTAATASGYQSTALGNGATASGNNTTAIGNGATTSIDNSLILGNSLAKVGIGNSAPNNKLEITQGTGGNSGLRFTNLISTNGTVTGNGKFLSVNTTGDVILTDGNGAITMSTPLTTSNANGATINASEQLQLAPADATNPGIVTTGAQIIAGAKTLTGATSINNTFKLGSVGTTQKNIVSVSGTSSFSVPAAVVNSAAVTITPGSYDLNITIPSGNALSTTQASVSVSYNGILPVGVSIANSYLTSTTNVRVRFVNSGTTAGAINGAFYATVNEF